MKSIIVLSTQEQLCSFIRTAECSGIMVFCDNEALYPLLSNEKIAFTRLDEFLLREEWPSINSWGLGKSTGWIKLCSHLTPENEPDVLPGMFLRFSSILIAAVKNYLFAKHVIESFKPSQVYVFKDASLLAFPTLSGNAMLNYFLETLAFNNSIPVQAIPVSPMKQRDALTFRLRIRRFLKSVFDAIFIRIPCANFKKHVLVYGSLRHLESVIDALHCKGVPMIIFDSEFYGKSFSFAVSRGISYITSSRLSAPDPETIRWRGDFLSRQLAIKFDYANIQKYFQYKDVDFGAFIGKVVFRTMTDYFENVALEWWRCSELMGRFNLVGCLVEEDYDGRGNFCEFMKRSGVRNFCISHAHGSFDFEVDPSYRFFAQSFTFVNSEDEKLRMYGARGWDAASIVVTGVPRYDRLRKMCEQVNKKKKLSKLLFCAGELLPYSPDMRSVLGSDIYSFRGFQEHSFRQVIKALQGLSIEMVIKPHYDQDEQMWKDFLKEIKPPNRISLEKHSADFFKLLLESDAMLLSYWSTSLIEAAICRKPIFYLDFKQQESPSVKRFAEAGFCQIIRTVPEFQDALDQFDPQRYQRKICQDHRMIKYYLGMNDGRATQRVADFMLKIIQGDSHVTA